jgi:hypothetical protein
MLAKNPCLLSHFHLFHANCELLQVVPKHSAILARYTARTIHSDHVNMTKFANHEDDGYKKISGELRRWVKTLKLQQEPSKLPEVNLDPRT